MGRPLPANLIGERKATFFERMIDAVVKDPKRRKSNLRKAPSPQDVLVLVSKVYDDYEDMQHGMIVEALSEIPGIRVEVVDRDLARMIPGLAVSDPHGPGDDALTVYGEHGAGRMANVTERNLLRPEKQMKDASAK